MRTFLAGVVIGITLLGAASAENGAPSGFVIRISPIDFFMIQRGLMMLPDELASVRTQMQQAALGTPSAAFQSVGIPVMLHHSRFADVDRQYLDRKVLGLIGLGGRSST
jgi:hypothetical protein